MTSFTVCIVGPGRPRLSSGESIQSSRSAKHVEVHALQTEGEAAEVQVLEVRAGKHNRHALLAFEAPGAAHDLRRPGEDIADTAVADKESKIGKTGFAHGHPWIVVEAPHAAGHLQGMPVVWNANLRMLVVVDGEKHPVHPLLQVKPPDARDVACHDVFLELHPAQIRRSSSSPDSLSVRGAGTSEKILHELQCERLRFSIVPYSSFSHPWYRRRLTAL